MQRSELRRAKLSFGGHEIFSEEIGVLDHRALERLKNHTTLFEIFGNNRPLDQLIVRKNHPARELIEPARILQNIFPIIFRERTGTLERHKIEKIDIRKAPRLIFASWSWNRFEFFPGLVLLLAKPIGQFAIDRAGKNSGF